MKNYTSQQKQLQKKYDQDISPDFVHQILSI